MHTATYFQGKLTKEQLSQCDDCILKENLWLNLSSGHIGCGRRNFDGSGGNGHALKHYEETGNPLAVKLGTISAEGNASVFCYKCDEDVKVPNLPQILKNMGIDVDTMVKTEKTMTELNLELNLTFTLSKAYEKGKELKLVSGAGKTGLENIGNSCYLNSVLQVLFNVDEVRERYFEAGQNFLKKTKRELSTCFMAQMSKLGHGLWSGEFGKIYEEEIEVPSTGEKATNQFQDGIKPYMFRHLVGKGHIEFCTNRQQDAMEYLMHLLQILDKNEKNFGLNPTTSLFGATLETRVVNLAENKAKSSEIVSKFLKVPIPQHPLLNTFTSSTPVEDMQYSCSFQDCLKLFTAPTSLNNGLSQKTTGLSTFPKYLILNMEKFVLNGWVPIKLHCDVKFDDFDDIDLGALRVPELPEGVVVEEADEGEAIQVDEGALAQIMSMGFGKNRATRALIECGNNVENALNWIFSSMDDPSLDDPIDNKKKSK